MYDIVFIMIIQRRDFYRKIFYESDIKIKKGRFVNKKISEMTFIHELTADFGTENEKLWRYN